MDLFAELATMDFANEDEEALWWESHEDELFEEFKKAVANGTIGIGTVAKRAQQT
jgi:hypothetical protein